jgi:hypothetical protein
MGMTGSVDVRGEKREQNRAAGCCETHQMSLVVAHGLVLVSVWMVDAEERRRKDEEQPPRV